MKIKATCSLRQSHQTHHLKVEEVSGKEPCLYSLALFDSCRSVLKDN